MLISTALLLDSNIRNSVCTPAKLPCRRVVEGSDYYERTHGAFRKTEYPDGMNGSLYTGTKWGRRETEQDNSGEAKIYPAVQ
jgi:hypothetical protein